MTLIAKKLLADN